MMLPTRLAGLALLAGLFAGLLAAACGGGAEQQAARSEPDQPPAAQQTVQQTAAEQAPADQAADQSEQPAQAQQQEQPADAPAAADLLRPATVDELSPRLALLTDGGYPVYVSEAGFTVALGTPDLGIGDQRLSIVVESAEGLVEFPALALRYWPADGGPANAAEALAAFTLFPDGVRGFHVAQLTFEQAGDWVLSVRTPTVDGFVDLPLAIEVRADPRAPAVGEQPPASINRTLRDVSGAEQLSTGAEPDAALYELTIAEALERGESFIIVFASPGFCTNAFCGPQVEVLSELRRLHPAKARYIHVDLYENPLEVRRGEPPQETPLLEEWGLETDEWTFVIGADGKVAARFEAFAPLEEVEAALLRSWNAAQGQ